MWAHRNVATKNFVIELNSTDTSYKSERDYEEDEKKKVKVKKVKNPRTIRQKESVLLFLSVVLSPSSLCYVTLF